VEPIDFLERYRLILTEGAVIERLSRDPKVTLDRQVLNAVLFLKPAGERAMAAIYQEYLTIGRELDLPLILATPTWRANQERVSASAYRGWDLNREAVRFIQALGEEAGDYQGKVLIAGLMGPRGNAYDPAEALAEGEAARFHSWQAESLAQAGVDFLQAATMPALSEAVGMARAMAQTGRPYSVSFVIRGEGRLLDGTPLAEAIETLDQKVSPRAWFMGINCVHPTVLARALESQPAWIRGRLLALQANTSTKSPEELDGSAETETEEPDLFARAMIGLGHDFGLRILGGCCGTDGRHIRALAGLIRGRLDEPASGA